MHTFYTIFNLPFCWTPSGSILISYWLYGECLGEAIRQSSIPSRIIIICTQFGTVGTHAADNVQLLRLGQLTALKNIEPDA